ncbi:uncharacterized protein PHACADRAFT_101156 [Phanerochaete carnosa HHB-10118-sp]|uniref:Dynamin-type G domain-containing protein n=1 Tax=Phanerochaete carnosa (strain HHB-10118-sp) TaxID=650164 RepID=K5UQU2_PHACS|nr:uncharacterized protein PHACADRAFT_101156 [Phanerochaete carnosa HHB-10118-sp]EKM52206.1 hypothetical protein PHACADRAFT_101156 [Phanerochaete carnosa HHB-10118-sp]
MSAGQLNLGSVLTGIDNEYAQRRKQRLALINQLRAIGAQAEFDLPRVAVIGNQSAGKSSLVEAISGVRCTVLVCRTSDANYYLQINVPRDAGTCTRCPMGCRLSSSTQPWTCQISIRWSSPQKGLQATSSSNKSLARRCTIGRTSSSCSVARKRRCSTRVHSPEIL